MSGLRSATTHRCDWAFLVYLADDKEAMNNQELEHGGDPDVLFGD
jgi:hypothetical protein